MGDNEIPGKRPRVVTIEELQEQIANKNSEIEILKRQFNVLFEENRLLKENMQSLMQKMNSTACNDSCDECSTEEEMVVENELNANNQAKAENAGGVKATQQNVSDVNVFKQAVKMVPNQNVVAGSSQKVSGHAVLREAVKMVPTQPNTVNGTTGSSQKKPNGNRKEGASKSVPIVTTYNVNIKNITNELSKILGHDEYNIKILSKNITNIGVCTLEDFEKLKHMLKDQGVHFYTHTPKSQRPFSVVVKGLSDTFESNEVIEYMQGLQVNVRILGVHKLGGDRWLFQMGRDSDIKGFRNIKYILHCKVTMTRHSRRDIIQCYNCQRFGHVAINCNMPYRCVKCSGDHGPGKCVIPPKDENNVEIISTDPVTGQAIRKVGFPIKCANCGIEGHAASAKDCPRRQELMRKIAAKKNEKTTNGRLLNVSSSGRVNGISYAAATRTNPISTSPDNVTLESARSEFDTIDRDCKRLFGNGLLDCLNRIRGFAREYRNLNSDEEKSRALLGMLISLQ